MVARFDPDLGTYLDPRLDNPTIDGSGGEIPRDQTPTAEHGATLPVFYGTAVASPLIVYQQTFGSGIGFKTYQSAQTGWQQRTDALAFKAVLAIGEAPILGIKHWWSGGSPAISASELGYLCSGYNRAAAAGSTASTINLNTALPAALMPGGVVWFTSGVLSSPGPQYRVIQSSTTTSITVTVAFTQAPATGDSLSFTDGFSVQTSETPGTPLSWLAGDAVGMGFGGTAFFAAQSLVVDENGKVPAIRFEVRGQHIVDPDAPPLGNGNEDPNSIHANPADVVVDLLTAERYGVGLTAGQVEVDIGPDGNAASSYRTYCANMGLLVSRAITDRASASDLLGELLVCTNSVAVCTGGKIKIVPRGDTAIGTYVPPVTAAVLDDDEILREGSNDPVTIRRTPDQDVYNVWPVKIANRWADYEAAEYESEDTAHSAEYGQRRAPSTSLPWITEPTIARQISSLRAQRSIYVRNTYRFKVKPKWVVLEPMDYVSISHTVGGLSNILCRIVSIRRLADGALEIDAEEAPLGSAHPVDLTPAPQDGYDSAVPSPSYISDVAAGNVGNTTYVGPTAPPFPNVGDSWIDTANGNQLKVWNGTQWVLGAAGPQGNPGTDAKLLTLSATSTVFHVAKDATYSPTSITFTANLSGGLTGDTVWDVTAGTATLTGSGTSRSLTYANASTDTVTVRVRVVDGVTTYEDSVTVVKLREGVDGGRGAGWFYASSSAGTATWSDSTADGATPGANVFQDRVTIYNNGATPPWSMTKFWDGSAWQTVTMAIDGNLLVTGTVAGDKIAANSITTDKLTVGNFDNLCPNPNTALTALSAGSIEMAGVVTGVGSEFANNGALRAFTLPADGSRVYLTVTGRIPCNAGDQFYAECKAGFTYNTVGTINLWIEWYDQDGTWLSASASSALGAVYDTTDTDANRLSVSGTAPYGTKSCVLTLNGTGGNAAQSVRFNNFYFRRRVSGPALVVDGTAVFGSGYAPADIKGDVWGVLNGSGGADRTTTTIDGGQVTTGTLDASAVDVVNLNADNITSGNLSTANLSLGGHALSALGQNTAVARISLNGTNTPALASSSFGVTSVARTQKNMNPYYPYVLTVTFTQGISSISSAIFVWLEEWEGYDTGGGYRAAIVGGTNYTQAGVGDFVATREIAIKLNSIVDPNDAALNGIKVNVLIAGGL